MKIDDTIIDQVASRADEMIGANLNLVSKQTLKNILYKRSIRIDPFFWNNGSLSWALHRYSAHSKKPVALPNNAKLLHKKSQIKIVDNTLFFYANYEKFNPSTIQKVYTFLKESQKDAAGSILYRKNDNAAYLDTMGMICPFLARYGKENASNEATKCAMEQFRAFFTQGIDSKTKLPYHGYDLSRNEKAGIIGWGRGIGWLLNGLTESLNWLEPLSDEYREVESYLKNILNETFKYQRSDGSFSWQLQAMEGHLDTSTTAMIGYSLARYNNIAQSKVFKNELVLMMNSVLKNIDQNGQVLNSSAECAGFSMYPQRFESNSWGQAFTLLFLIESLERNKYSE